jgi:hypothetical protein
VFRETVSAMLASIHELPPAPTVVREYQPWAGSAPAPGLRVVHRTTGHCWESALSARSDALRCSLDQGAPGGGTLMDPCFVSPVNTHAVLCPFAEPNDKRVVRIDSDASSITSHSPTAVASQPWWIDIGHGDACGATAGATTVALGERANYGCSSGTWLWGYPDRSKPQWTIHIAADLHPKSFGSVAIRVAWF